MSLVNTPGRQELRKSIPDTCGTEVGTQAPENSPAREFPAHWTMILPRTTAGLLCYFRENDDEMKRTTARPACSNASAVARVTVTVAGASCQWPVDLPLPELP
jgi:hypothetical protein